ncbi:hypothetical protein Q7P37_010935 [Cladosporium fusiforme]
MHVEKSEEYILAYTSTISAFLITSVLYSVSVAYTHTSTIPLTFFYTIIPPHSLADSGYPGYDTKPTQRQTHYLESSYLEEHVSSNRLRICTAQDEIPSDEESPRLPEQLLESRPRRVRGPYTRPTVREALHSALGSSEPVELLASNPRDAAPRTLLTDGNQSHSRRPSVDDTNAPELNPEAPLSRSPTPTDDEESPTKDA